MAITQVITTLPAAPDPATDTRDEFSTKAAASVLAQKAMVPELNTWAGQVNAIAATAVGDVATAIGAAAADTPVGTDEFAWRKVATGVLKKVTFTNALAWFAAAAGSVSQAFEGSTLKAATTVGVGGATPAASGAGITFPATQSASSDANTLDDYEEGTFTPTITFGGGSSVTYATQLGTYTKIGRAVSFNLQLVLASRSSSGNVQVLGLPFAAPNDFARTVAVRLSGSLGSIAVCQGYVNQSDTSITLEKLVAGTSTMITDTDIGGTAQITLSGNYTI